MHPENVQNSNKHGKAAEDASPAASASEIMNRETPSGKLWPFIGGVALGAVSVIAAALMADAMSCGAGGESELPESEAKEMLALPDVHNVNE